MAHFSYEDGEDHRAKIMAVNGLWLGVLGEPREGVRVQASEEPFTWEIEYHAGEYRYDSS
jgi:hypothetical protein